MPAFVVRTYLCIRNTHHIMSPTSLKSQYSFLFLFIFPFCSVIPVFCISYPECGKAITYNSGIIRSRGFPTYIGVSDCDWDINRENDNQTVILTFEHFDLPSSFNCR